MSTSKAGGKLRRTRYSDYERWVGLQHWMLKSTAWQLLSPNAVKVLIAVWQRYNGINNGEISYSCREAEVIGLHRNTACRALEELVDSGFLKVARDSAFTVKSNTARLWTITALPMLGSTTPTREFMDRKIRTQSHGRDTLSRQRDTEAGSDPKTASSVPPEGQFDPVSPPNLSHQRDISNYQAGSVGDRGEASVRPSTRSERSPATLTVVHVRKDVA